MKTSRSVANFYANIENRRKERILARVKKTWQLLPHDDHAIDHLARELNVASVVAQLLLNRHVTDAEDARRFLHAPLSGLHEPERLPGVPEAAERIYLAIQEKRSICIYGDYDVDGVTGTTILVTVLRALGANVSWHVPHRVDDGYGLNAKALGEILQSGAGLVVTVDCGIASIAEAEEARRLGLELIITDHHEFKERLPDADVIVHPRLENGDYPFGGLAGSGVALKLAWAVGKVASGGDKVSPEVRDVLLDAVGLAAMGTVADVMPLLDENRIIVRHGLNRLKHSAHLGFQALLQAAKVDNKAKLAASDVGFSIAPRLNAAGRMGSARTAVELLLAESPQQAEDLATLLNTHNQRRQQIERKILWDARDMIDRSGHHDKAALVLAHSAWHPGLIGIVAGRLTDAYGRPALMIAMPKDAEVAVGSGRSVPGFKLHEALAACDDHLLTHGGHAAAAGFKLRPTQIQHFRDQFITVVADRLGPTPPPPMLTLDAEVPLSVLTLKLVETIGQLEPYGAGNPQPLFLAGNLHVSGEPRTVGDHRHLSFRVRQQGKELKAIAFNMADRLEELMSEGGACCLAFTPIINEWQGWRNVELLVRDLQAGERAELS